MQSPVWGRTMILPSPALKLRHHGTTSHLMGIIIIDINGESSVKLHLTKGKSRPTSISHQKWAFSRMAGMTYRQRSEGQSAMSSKQLSWFSWPELGFQLRYKLDSHAKFTCIVCTCSLHQYIKSDNIDVIKTSVVRTDRSHVSGSSDIICDPLPQKGHKVAGADIRTAGKEVKDNRYVLHLFVCFIA